VTCFVFVFTAFYIFFKVVDVLMGNRVSAEVELEGLDIPEMGALAYPDFVLGPGTPMGGFAAGATETVQKGAPSLTPARAEH
jgi:Amt family ammonium transporter